jgi:hypothetical protein
LWKYIDYKINKKAFLKNKKNKWFNFATIDINFIFAPAIKPQGVSLNTYKK